MSEQDPADRPDSDSVYTARARVEKVEGLHRRAHLATGEVVDFGVHSPITEMFRLTVDRERALPVDYIVAAAAG